VCPTYRYQKEQLSAELNDVVEQMAKEEDFKGHLQDQVGGRRRRSDATCLVDATGRVGFSVSEVCDLIGWGSVFQLCSCQGHLQDQVGVWGGTVGA
jgi:hypothetical protein